MRRVIEDGYDAIADRFAACQRQIEGSTRLERIEELLELLPARRLVEQAGLDVLRDDIEVSLEPEGEARFQWLLARRPE